MLYDDWATLARTVLITPLAYLALLLVLRWTGKRTLAKLNAFDLIVTVALGSVLASVAVTPDVTLTSGVAAFAILVALQYLIASLSVRVRRAQRLVKAKPTLLLHNGVVLEDALDRQRVTRSELLQVLRQHGVASLGDCAAVVLETDGTMSVMRSQPPADHSSTLADVAGAG